MFKTFFSTFFFQSHVDFKCGWLLKYLNRHFVLQSSQGYFGGYTKWIYGHRESCLLLWPWRAPGWCLLPTRMWNSSWNTSKFFFDNCCRRILSHSLASLAIMIPIKFSRPKFFFRSIFSFWEQEALSYFCLERFRNFFRGFEKFFSVTIRNLIWSPHVQVRVFKFKYSNETISCEGSGCPFFLARGSTA